MVMFCLNFLASTGILQHRITLKSYNATTILLTSILIIYHKSMPNTDMIIVASTASMLEEPYWRIEEPNPLKQQKGSSMRLHHLISLTEATH